MFICDECLKRNYKNWGSMAKSQGRCEICGDVMICSDISSQFLRPRDSDRTCGNCHRGGPSIAANHVVCQRGGWKGRPLQHVDMPGCDNWKQAPEGWGEAL